MKWQGQRPEGSEVRNENGGEETKWHHSFKKYGYEKKKKTKQKRLLLERMKWEGLSVKENFFKVENA